MTKFIGLISAKGGVGKTTTTINLTSALHFFKRNVIALDANFANPDLGIHLGVPNVTKNLHTSLKKKHSIRDSVYKHPSGIKIIPGSVSYKEGRTAARDNLLSVIYELFGTTEAVIIDSTPGLGRDAEAVIHASDCLLIVTTPDMCAVTGSLKMVKLAHELEKEVLGIIVNRKRHDDYEMSEQNIAEFLGKPVIGVIPEEDEIRNSLQTNHPLVISNPNNVASIAFKKIAGILIGEKYMDNVEMDEEDSMFNVTLKRLGF